MVFLLQRKSAGARDGTGIYEAVGVIIHTWERVFTQGGVKWTMCLACPLHLSHPSGCGDWAHIFLEIFYTMMQLPLNLEINASQISSEASKPKPSQQPCNAGVIPPHPHYWRDNRGSVSEITAQLHTAWLADLRFQSHCHQTQRYANEHFWSPYLLSSPWLLRTSCTFSI